MIGQIDALNSKERETKGVHWLHDSLDVPAGLWTRQRRIACSRATICAQAEKAQVPVGAISGDNGTARNLRDPCRTNAKPLFFFPPQKSGFVNRHRAIAARPALASAFQFARRMTKQVGRRVGLPSGERCSRGVVE